MISIIHLSQSAVCPWRPFLSSLLSCRIRLLSDSTTRQRFQRKFQIIWIPKLREEIVSESQHPSKHPGLLSQGAVSMPFRWEIQLLGNQPGSHPAQRALWGRQKYFTLWGCLFCSRLFHLPTLYVSPSLSGSETSVTRERSPFSVRS